MKVVSVAYFSGISEVVRDLLEQSGGCLIRQFPIGDNSALLALGRKLGVPSADQSLPHHPLENEFIYRVEKLQHGLKDGHGRPILSTTNDQFPLHTDGSNREIPYSIVLLLCCRQDTVGGETILLHLDDIRACLSAPVVANLCRPAYSFSGKKLPILFGEQAALKVRYNYDNITALPDDLEAEHALTEFKKTLEKLTTCDFKLEVGDCLVLDNQRVLHGRRAFSSDSYRLLKRLRLNSRFSKQAVL